MVSATQALTKSEARDGFRPVPRCKALSAKSERSALADTMLVAGLRRKVAEDVENQVRGV